MLYWLVNDYCDMVYCTYSVHVICMYSMTNDICFLPDCVFCNYLHIFLLFSNNVFWPVIKKFSLETFKLNVESYKLDK